MIPSDTDPRIDAMMLEGYRRMSPAQKLAIVDRLSLMVQELALADIRRRHPDADARELKLRLASRRLDSATMRRVFGWDPELMGY